MGSWSRLVAHSKGVCGIIAVTLALANASLGTPQSASAASVKESPVMRIPPIGPSAQQWKIDESVSLPELPLRQFTAERSGVFGGKKVNYSVIAKDSILRDDASNPIGSIFSFSYIQHGQGQADKRPVIFIFNGGPGSASIWLHMGVLGPRKADFVDVTPRQVPPFDMIDNPDSALAVADLVFIDPIGTGFSQYWGKGRSSDFYGREQDAAATVRFINGWLREHGRWNSPKFLLGESYGTHRANLVARRLMGGFLDGTLKGVSLNGVILVGGDGGLATPAGNDKYLVTFTTMAATAWHHNLIAKNGRTFEQFIEQADGFARQELVPGLDRWDALPVEKRRELARLHAAFTGLSEAFLMEKQLRIQPSDYVTHILADKGEVVGFYDSRYTLPMAGSLGDPVADDAAMGQYSAPFIGAFNTYIRNDLDIAIDDDYVVIDWVNVNLPFDHGVPSDAPNSTTSVPGSGDPGGDLAAMMRRNPDLYLMSAQGWFDMFGAVGTAKYGIAQRKLPMERVEEHAYLSGHMAYVGAAGKLFADDLKAFVAKASAGRPN